MIKTRQRVVLFKLGVTDSWFNPKLLWNIISTDFFLDMLTSHMICMLINSTTKFVSFFMHVHSILTLTLLHFPFTHSDLPTIPPSPSSERLHLPLPPLQNSNDGRAFTVFISFKANMWHSAVPAETFDGSELRSALRAARLGTFLHAVLQDWSGNKKVSV